MRLFVTYPFTFADDPMKSEYLAEVLRADKLGQPFWDCGSADDDALAGGLMYSWQEDYIAAFAETDPVRLRRRVYQALAAMEQRRLSALEPGSEEHQALEDAERALQILKDGLPRE
jgi:hypothetical protein